MSLSLSVLGCGNMAGSLARSIASHEKAPQFFCFDPIIKKAEDLAKDLNGVASSSISDLPKTNWYMIGCKPGQFDQLSKFLKNELTDDSMIISMMAGKSILEIQSKLGKSRVVRIMPNTPVIVGSGVITAKFSANISGVEREIIESLFSNKARFFVFENEEHINITTGVSGSGPAYFFEIARIMSQQLISKGIDEKIASELSALTILGSGKLLAKSNEKAEDLRNQVTSKGGTTEAALNILRENDLQKILFEALDAAYARSKNL